MNHWDKKPPRTSQRVRQPKMECLAGVDSEQLSPPPAHPSQRLLIQLNSQWRVIDDDLQFILQQRNGKARSKAKGWSPRSFCRTREALLRCIREYCGSVEDKALEQVRALPEWHIDR